ncbi:hypothetical protein EJ02DRAFT_35101 [Clathrospora elynae]|uniref:Uncharacterized protein n=1 Tax=Clathrospora elynae TaxID=706981 RepID=A0A6A5SY94_9PLEO|nr:hypothetical protein EJ02DRAFT_35101 [Clathrospora elynae]
MQDSRKEIMANIQYKGFVRSQRTCERFYSLSNFDTLHTNTACRFADYWRDLGPALSRTTTHLSVPNSGASVLLSSCTTNLSDNAINARNRHSWRETVQTHNCPLTISSLATSDMAHPLTTATTADWDTEPKDGRPLLRASTTFYDRVVTDWWWWELLSWTVSFACATAIVGVLWFYDGKRQTEYLATGITPNAYVAVFAAVSKAALILPVSEAIGQLKWVWFQEAAL